MNPKTTKTSELNTRQLEQRKFNFNGIHVDVVGSANNKAKTLRMGNVNGRKFTEKKKKEKKKYKVEEFQLANLARPSQAIIKSLFIRFRQAVTQHNLMKPC